MLRCIERLVGDAIVEALLRNDRPNGNLAVNGVDGTLSLQMASIVRWDSAAHPNLIDSSPSRGLRH